MRRRRSPFSDPSDIELMVNTPSALKRGTQHRLAGHPESARSPKHRRGRLAINVPFGRQLSNHIFSLSSHLPVTPLFDSRSTGEDPSAVQFFSWFAPATRTPHNSPQIATPNRPVSRPLKAAYRDRRIKGSDCYAGTWWRLPLLKVEEEREAKGIGQGASISRVVEIRDVDPNDIVPKAGPKR